jgi:DNA gyrase inhibitor GyrI
MGWASAGNIFEPVANAMIRTHATDAQKRDVLSTLIKTLQDGDWDTASESLGLYVDDPAIVDAFRANGVVVTCDDENDHKWCEEERGHPGRHRNWRGDEW